MALDSQSAATPPPGGASSDPVPAPEAEVDQSTYASVFLATFSTVFLAELGDKTQLAALLLSAESGRPVIVFFGASLALICSSLVGVLLGRWLARFIPAQLLERLAGILMVALGLWLGRQAVLSFLPTTPLVPLP
jgi:putative Ca2+/H+ antiporter (TMEM165/GDT1 family)